MKRSSLVLVALVLAGCSSTAARAPTSTALPEEPPPSPKPADSSTTTPTTPAPAEKTPKGDAAPKPLKGDPAHNRPPESKEEQVAAETERSVQLPDSIELVAAPSLPERPRIAVAFVRGGKLVRRADALRRLAHDFSNEGRIEALERFSDDAPSTLSLTQLCERAEKQGALLLLVDTESTSYVVQAKPPIKGLNGQDFIARLVKSVRGGS